MRQRVALIAVVVAVAYLSVVLQTSMEPGPGAPAGSALLDSLVGPDSIPFGSVVVEPETNSVWLPGEVRQDEGWVQFLLHTEGYAWLEERSAITSHARLADLQKALAYLDWRRWDSVWAQAERTEAFSIYVWLRSDDGLSRVQASDLIDVSHAVDLRDVIFPGSPYFDDTALDTTSAAVCAGCPLFPLEQELIESEFARPTGETGYSLTDCSPLATGMRVVIQIILKDGG